MTDSDELVVPATEDELRALEQQLAEGARYGGQATNTERARWRRDAAQLRVLERQQADERPVSVDALGEKFGWSPALMFHLVQPYCRCEIGHDGWLWCRHAEDEQLDAWVG